MDPNRQQARLRHLERQHFWFVARTALLDQLLHRHLGTAPQQILDVGSGTGWMAQRLNRQGHAVVGLDLEADAHASLQDSEVRLWRVRAQATQLPLSDKTFDAVLLLDTLEHTDDRAALEEIRRVLKPAGMALITVPAIPWLWSYRDEAAGHLRRYTRPKLIRLLEAAHLRIEEIRYYQCLLLPLVIVTRLLGRRGPRMRNLEEQPAPFLNRVLTWINLLEVRWSRVIPWPWGSTLVAVCRKETVPER